MLKDSGVPLAEWISRDQYFKKFGGNCDDPLETKPLDTTTATATEIKKSAAVERARVQVEQLWEAPEEFQGV